MNKTSIYHNRTMFELICDGCGVKILPSETYATEYHKSNGDIINVLEAYKLRTNEKYSKVYCTDCKPSRK